MISKFENLNVHFEGLETGMTSYAKFEDRCILLYS
jgi:hypothetical protein